MPETTTPTSEAAALTPEPGRTSNMPVHYSPLTLTSLTFGPVLTQVKNAVQTLNKVNINAQFDTVYQTTQSSALQNKNETESEAIKLLFNDLKQNSSDERQALCSKFQKIQNKQVDNYLLETYCQETQQLAVDFKNSYDQYLTAEKNRFYEKFQPCEHVQNLDQLWEEHEQLLTQHILEPVEEFSQATNSERMLQQAFIQYLNQARQKNQPVASAQRGTSNDAEFQHVSSAVDREGIPYRIKYKDGKISEINIQAIKGMKMGSFADALITYGAASANGLQQPFRIKIHYTQPMEGIDPGLIQVLILFVYTLVHRAEEARYRQGLQQAISETGINGQNITVVDSNGRPVEFPQEFWDATAKLSRSMLQQTVQMTKEANATLTDDEPLDENENRPRLIP